MRPSRRGLPRIRRTSYLPVNNRGSYHITVGVLPESQQSSQHKCMCDAFDKDFRTHRRMIHGANRCASSPLDHGEGCCLPIGYNKNITLLLIALAHFAPIDVSNADYCKLKKMPRGRGNLATERMRDQRIKSTV